MLKFSLNITDMNITENCLKGCINKGFFIKILSGNHLF
jgi:hypothetical protein